MLDAGVGLFFLHTMRFGFVGFGQHVVGIGAFGCQEIRNVIGFFLENQSSRFFQGDPKSWYTASQVLVLEAASSSWLRQRPFSNAAVGSIQASLTARVQGFSM